MVLKLDDVFERQTFYLGRFYETEEARVMSMVLRPGDCFIDVGANIGMLTLTGAALVGATGNVLAFEPNPQARRRLRLHRRLNRLDYVKVFGIALSSTRGTATLNLPTERSGRSTLRSCESPVGSYETEVAVLDDFLDLADGHERICLKTDTEGYDLHVLKGARQLLKKTGLIVMSEIFDGWLREAGHSAQELVDYMEEAGYSAYYPVLEGRGFRHRLTLRPLRLPGPHYWYNGVFLQEQDCRALRHCIRDT